MNYGVTIKLAILNTLFTGMIGLAACYGFVLPIFLEDASRLTIICAALMAATLVVTTLNGLEIDHWSKSRKGLSDMDPAWWEECLSQMTSLPRFLKAKVFLYLGLAGTVIGLSLFAKHMALDSGQASTDAIKATLQAIQGSMLTAFNATLVGIVCKVWTETIVYIQEREIGEIRECVSLRLRDARG